jgi:hypothetical protein
MKQFAGYSISFLFNEKKALYNMYAQLNKVRKDGKVIEVIRTIFDDDEELLKRLNYIREVIDYIDDKKGVVIGEELLKIEHYLKTKCKENSNYYDGAPSLTWWPNMSYDAIIVALQLISIVKGMKDEIQAYKRAVDEYLTDEQKIPVLKKVLETLTQE